ncbi:LysM peptidoglycan-binding domain-containing protein [Capnocytophaga sp.]|uniref:LysM peptidoglycan-binding domain-containing protein n=1 Tax=Capnocytophaga sp. TaxID=44737 RepID=UPI0026DD5517|nr:LysM peptidoglycan-binding domain-containing protein [Capnocytophaga sp.]MDO5105946.1 LysM peptidoglycan-binding domain-containing protein [Capnocytophaga sp.]
MKKIITLVIFGCFGNLLLAQQQSHTVKANETIEEIAKTHRVSPSDITKQNPELKNGLKQGMVIYIPSGKVKYYSTQKPLSFKLHVVEAKETFFGLSQKYEITIDDLKRYNFDLYNRGLQEGETITIPVFGKTSNMVERGVQGQKKYVVKPQETLWRIAKNHNISQEELEKMNKGVTAENLKEGQELWVPSTGVETKPTNSDLVLYAVEKAEGFYSLERKFGLTEAELIKLNPELKNGLKSDTQIWIPKENFEHYKQGSTPLNSDNDLFKNSNQQLLANASASNVKEISFFLPFKVSDISETDRIATLKSRLTENKVTPIATDFYSGTLIALDSLQKMGYKFRANIFDSEVSDNELKKIINSSNVQNSQVIVGSFMAKSFNTLSAAVSNPETAILAPLSNKNIDLKANVYQTLPTEEVQQSRMIEFIQKNYGNANILILADTKNTSIRERLERTFPNAKVVTEITAGAIPNALDYNQENVVILQSNEIGYVSNAVRVLHNVLQSKKDNISPKIILTTIERGNVYDSNSLSNNQLSDLQFTYPTFNKFSNGNDNFSKRYLKTYGILPSKYAIRGFDLTMDIVLRLAMTGNFTSATEQIGETSYLENKFAYLKNPYKGGGFENQGVYIVKYDNMEIKEVK